jgi:hypothetical protein
MSPELDHIFIMSDVDAPEAAALARMGLVEGPANVHPGQGTACRRFFFPLQYLELLWVHSPAEAQNGTTGRTRLWERWIARQQGGCPFGLVLRPGAGAAPRPPFPTWSYMPGYLSDGVAIEIAIDTPVAEPEFFFLPFRTYAPDSIPRPCHALEATEMTHLHIGTPSGALLSSAARWAESAGLLTVEQSDKHVLTVTFDGATAGRRSDLRPQLPLVLRW